MHKQRLDAFTYKYIDRIHAHPQFPMVNFDLLITPFARLLQMS